MVSTQRRQRGKTGRDRGGRPVEFRLHPGRQALGVLAVLAAMLVGYFVVQAIHGGEEDTARRGLGADIPERPVENISQPWYRTQSPPPSLPSGPDAPILPEEDVALPRAYEEALPVEVYVPRRLPPPAAPPAPVVEVPAPDAVPAWRRFALAVPVLGEQPRVAIVIDDMGMDRRRSKRVTELDGPLTLSFLAYAEDLPEQTAQARAAGHELMLHVPMEPLSKAVDPGPNVLLTGQPEDELRRRLEWGLGRFEGFVGINNHMGSRFTADSKAMAVVMETLARRGLLFLDSRTTPETVGPALAHEAGVPVLERNVFLDNVNEKDAVRTRLDEVERLARRNGHAIAIGHPRDATIAVLSEWLAGLKARGVVLVPVTAILMDGGRETG